MIIFDQLKKNDPPLRLLAVGVLAGLLVLLTGLWWMQVVSSRRYQARLEMQSFRTVRLPAVRGKILDRNGVALAENRPSFNAGVYLEELSSQFRGEYRQLRSTRVMTNDLAFWERWLGFSAVKTQWVRLSSADVSALAWQARFNVVSNVMAELSACLEQPLVFDAAHFQRHYEARRALPYLMPVNLNPAQVARFEEQNRGPAATALEIQSLRYYPFQSAASHVLGYLIRDDRSYEGEEADFAYRLPDYRGVVGIEAGMDAELRGRAGAKSVLVNHLGYRQSEDIWSMVEPGRNVMLTLDMRIQQAAEAALARRVLLPTRGGAVVVMDVRNGDILALVSLPAPNPNHFIHGFPPGEYDKLNDPKLRPQINRASYENYAPGSIFKTIVGLACLENGMDKDALYQVQPDPANPVKGCIFVGRDKKRDTAPPGDYDFHRALLRSSNSYFITNGLRHHAMAKIVELGRRLHLGERIGLPTRQESAGSFPSLRRVASSAWRDGDTANICIGQGELAVTPLQMAVMTAALANGGTVFWPRLVMQIEPPENDPAAKPVVQPAGRVRDQLGVRSRNLRVLHEAMLADTEDPEGTAYRPFREYYRDAGVMRICGKTGTAQVTDEHNRLTGYNTWFIAFAPYERPRYAVVVMVENGGSGGGTCAPVASDIFAAIVRAEAGERGTLAENH